VSIEIPAQSVHSMIQTLDHINLHISPTYVCVSIGIRVQLYELMMHKRGVR
jgi:hypothetical protein